MNEHRQKRKKTTDSKGPNPRSWIKRLSNKARRVKLKGESIKYKQ